MISFVFTLTTKFILHANTLTSQYQFQGYFFGINDLGAFT
ncbi:hypothetical protein [Caudoviricetes sp.]|nr:hypothetical protein [Caudoviricetes sp.]